MKLIRKLKLAIPLIIFLSLQNCNKRCKSFADLPLDKNIDTYFNVFFDDDFWIYKNQKNQLDTFRVSKVNASKGCNNDGIDCFCSVLKEISLQGSFIKRTSGFRGRIDDRFRIIDTITNEEILSVYPLTSLYDESTGTEPKLINELIVAGNVYSNVIAVSNRNRNGVFYFAPKIGIVKYETVGDTFNLIKTNKK